MHDSILGSIDGKPATQDVKGFTEPEVIIGVAGIYDLKLLRDTNTHPAYQAFLDGAFSSDEKIWNAVSPALFKPASEFWPNGKMLVLVTSSGDELVDPSQIDVMGVQAGKWKEVVDKKLKVEVWKGMLEGGHDEIWSSGTSLAAVIERAIGLYFT